MPLLNYSQSILFISHRIDLTCFVHNHELLIMIVQTLVSLPICTKNVQRHKVTASCFTCQLITLTRLVPKCKNCSLNGKTEKIKNLPEIAICFVSDTIWKKDE